MVPVIHQAWLQVQSAVRGVMPIIKECVFRGNHAQRSGGAIGGKSLTGDLVIARSVLVGNTACAGGGGVAFTSTARVTLRQCMLAGNSAVVQGCAADRPAEWAAGQGGAVLHVRCCRPCCSFVRRQARQPFCCSWDKDVKTATKQASVCPSAVTQHDVLCPCIR